MGQEDAAAAERTRAALAIDELKKLVPERHWSRFTNRQDMAPLFQ
jgi:hypothetical protein